LRQSQLRIDLTRDLMQRTRRRKLVHEMPHALSIGQSALIRHMVPLAGRIGPKMLDPDRQRSIVFSLRLHADF
jgi:hypothetical protein